jgi:hypothetical protein
MGFGKRGLPPAAPAARWRETVTRRELAPQAAAPAAGWRETVTCREPAPQAAPPAAGWPKTVTCEPAPQAPPAAGWRKREAVADSKKEADPYPTRRQGETQKELKLRRQDWLDRHPFKKLFSKILAFFFFIGLWWFVWGAYEWLTVSPALVSLCLEEPSSITCGVLSSAERRAACSSPRAGYALHNWCKSYR